MIAIAIDGPAGAGKSTIARVAAKELGYLYVDTGALYRGVGLFVLEQGTEPSDEAGVASLLSGLKVDLAFREGEQRVLVNGEDVTARIRTPEVSMAASRASAIPAVREFLFHLQQDMAKTNNVVMDGRDIGTVVLPNAQVKIFLTASPEDRARRRYEELIQKGETVAYEAVLEDLKQRDYNDSHRTVAPLKPAPDSVLLDTTGNTLEQSIAQLLAVIRERLPKAVSPGKYRMSKLYKLLTIIGPAILHTFFRLKIEGKEKLPKEGGYILACNHISNFDPVLLAVAVVPRQVRYMAKEELFRGKLTGKFIRALGAFPVRRGAGDTGALNVGAEIVESGAVMGIFPEGTRSDDLKPMRAKSGIAVVASIAGADVYPAAIISKKEVGLFGKVRIIIGDRISKEEMAMTEQSHKEMKRVAGLIMNRITKLWERGYEEM